MTIGSLTRRSIRQKAASASTPTAARTTTAPALQARDWISARTTAVRPTVSATRPGKSIRLPAEGSVDSGAATAMIANPATMIGRLIQKIARQSISISAPPASGPTASAIAETAAQIPSARACSPFGKALQTIASERVRVGAAPTPWRTRPPISIAGLWAAPARIEPAPKTTIPIRKARLRPNMSPSRPAVTTRTAIVRR